MSRLAFALLIFACGASANSADLVRLSGFQSEAAGFNNRNTGKSTYRLSAVALWSPDAPRDPARYAVQITLPGGDAETSSLGELDSPRSARVNVDIPSERIRNLFPDDVKVTIRLFDKSTRQSVSNALTATIADFPRPNIDGPFLDRGPFGGGKPLAGKPGDVKPIPKPGPDGLRFVMIPRQGSNPSFLISKSETTNAQLSKRVKDYDPKAGRSDEFALERSDQPALNLTPIQAMTYLKMLRLGEGFEIPYRLPTLNEWTVAANAGKNTAFWWGDAETYPPGANLIGPEPGLETDTTATTNGFEPNPWGLFHTYGNVEEWVTGPAGEFLRVGNHFRSEPTTTLATTKVDSADAHGPDPYVGVRVALTLSASQGAALIQKQISNIANLTNVRVTYDPDSMVAKIEGISSETAVLREIDKRVGELWFVAAIDNQVGSPNLPKRGLAFLGKVVGTPRMTRPMGRRVQLIPIEVRYAELLPVTGSDWYANVFVSGGRSFSHRLADGEPGPSKRITLRLDLADIDGPKRVPLQVALSLGGPAAGPNAPNIVSNLADYEWITSQAKLQQSKN